MSGREARGNGVGDACESANIPQFPSSFLPATLIIAFLGAVLLIQRTITIFYKNSYSCSMVRSGNLWYFHCEIPSVGQEIRHHNTMAGSAVNAGQAIILHTLG
jgi:hypothetical protein